MKIKMGKFLYSTIILCLLLSGIGLNAQNYYVSIDTGLDSNDGSEAAPFKTINKGFTEVSAGGTVFGNERHLSK